MTTSEYSAATALAELGANVGIPDLALDADGRCRLLFDATRMVELAHLPAQGRWLLSCSFGEHGDAQQRENLDLVMRANHSGAGFGGGWASIAPSGHVCLQLPVASADASAATLLAATDLLLDHVQRWEKRMQQASSLGQQAEMARWAQRI